MTDKLPPPVLLTEKQAKFVEGVGRMKTAVDCLKTLAQYTGGRIGGTPGIGSDGGSAGGLGIWAWSMALQ